MNLSSLSLRLIALLLCLPATGLLGAEPVRITKVEPTVFFPIVELIGAFIVGTYTADGVDTYNVGFATEVDNDLFDALPDQDDPYFALTLSEPNLWSPTTSLKLSYDADKGNITDLAGNRLPSVSKISRCAGRSQSSQKLAPK